MCSKPTKCECVCCSSWYVGERLWVRKGHDSYLNGICGVTARQVERMVVRSSINNANYGSALTLRRRDTNQGWEGLRRLLDPSMALISMYLHSAAHST
jgi:hypothetical protein